MATVDVVNQSGEKVGSLELDDTVFSVDVKEHLLWEVVRQQLASRRAGTHSTLRWDEVRGGGRKPFRQKGTGRARQGSTRAPHWSGGGIALGPKPRSYKQRTPKKMIRLALASALSDRAAEGRVVVVDAWSFDAPSTKDAAASLVTLGLEGKVLVVMGPDDETAIKSFRNLPEVQLLSITELNAYDVLCNDWVVFTRGLLPGRRPGAERAGAVEGREPEIADTEIAATEIADSEIAATEIADSEAQTAEAGTADAGETGAEEGEA